MHLTPRSVVTSNAARGFIAIAIIFFALHMRPSRQLYAAGAGRKTIGLAAGTLPVSQTCDKSSPAQSYYLPCDANNAGSSTLTQNDYYDFDWQSFIALNWPALQGGQRGQPDPNGTIGGGSPVVWETYKQNTEVFLVNGTQPGGWNDSLPFPCTTHPGVKAMGKVASPVSRTTLNEVNQAGLNFGQFLGPLVDQNGNFVLYEIRLDQSEFTYVYNLQYYNATNQINAVTGKTFQVPPKTGQEVYLQTPLPTWAQTGAVEIKAAWRVLDPVKDKDRMQRYYTRDAYFVSYVNNTPTCQYLGTMGLIGLHILRLTATNGSTWTWATFEQVDNTEIDASNPPSPPTPSLNPGPMGSPPPPYNPNGYYGQQPPSVPSGPLPANPQIVNVSRLTAISPAIQAANAKYRPLLPAPFSYYQLVAAVNPNPPNTPSPGCTVPFSGGVVPNVCVAANTTMETYEQSISCLSCHAKGTPQGTQPNPSFQIFTFLLQEAQKAPQQGAHTTK